MPRRGWLDQVALIAERGRMVLARAGISRSADLRASCQRLLSQRGEASGLALSTELVAAVTRMTAAETAAFLEMLARDFGPDPDQVREAVRNWERAADEGSLAALSASLEPPRQELFRRLNTVPGGTRALVSLRARLLDLLTERPQLVAVDADLRHLFASWFNRGFLTLEEIDWHTPADILERLIRYEAVHEIRGWGDLRGRLAADRRCFAFFHPALPGDPLIFVEVALTRGVPGAIGPLIDPERQPTDPATADTATFYSISNCQQGLRGISFGSFLIKQVTSELCAALPRIKTFVTLSPVPGFAAALARRDDPDGFTVERVRALIGDAGEELRKLAGAGDPVEALDRLLAAPHRPLPVVERVLRRLVLAFLLHVRRGSRVADPVAHFHLANGARLEALNPAGDGSTRPGNSFGLMVNYLYQPEALEFNHERYVESGRLAFAPALSREARRVDEAWAVGRQACPEGHKRSEFEGGDATRS